MPRFSPDGRQLYFLRLGSPENVGGEEGGEDIWYAERNAAGDWAVVRNPGGSLNTARNDFVAAVLDGGDRLLIGHGGAGIGGSGSAFSFIRRQGSEWGPPEPLIIEDWHTLTPWVSATLSADGATLIFHAEREGGLGGTDLYVSFLREDGTWSEPVGLGPDVNTSGHEITPHLAADGETLYFSSDGHGGYGGQDIYLTRRLDASWQRWSSPENLGPRINSPGFDAYFVVPDGSEYGYLASSAGALGGTDLFRVLLREPEPVLVASEPEPDPEPVVLVRGRVIDEESGAPLGATVRFSADTAPEEGGEIASDQVTGTFSITLPEGRLYTFQAEAARYLGASARVDASAPVVREFELELHLVPIREGARVVLRHVYFDFGSAQLRSDSEAELRNLFRFLEANPDVRVEVQGHTDSVGSEAVNHRLSTARAHAVRTYLLERGITPARIEARGYGSSSPVATNETDEGRQLNRRVELRILGEAGSR